MSGKKEMTDKERKKFYARIRYRLWALTDLFEASSRGDDGCKITPCGMSGLKAIIEDCVNDIYELEEDEMAYALVNVCPDPSVSLSR